MKILVTGSNGLLGQKLSALLMEKGISFLATGVGENRNPSLPSEHYRTMDVTSASSMEAVFQEFNTYICAEVLADEIRFIKELTKGEETDINGISFKINVLKKG
jgi:dTDP-4-dehydrorhamnose reductase